MNVKLMIKIFFVLLFTVPQIVYSEGFVVVLDPGHGGKDPGAIGVVVKEKDINLSVALKLGTLIEQRHPDVKVVYTRKKDHFIELDRRADIANENKANLFISIHANAISNKNFNGAETYTLGLARTKENLEVAKRENAAILLEDNYQQRYEDFDPNSTESYIIFEFIQNKYLEQSIEFASYIQKELYSSARRKDRGVKQAGFLVLRKTSMPSVLIELGFISNLEEENYMRSDRGQINLSESIYRAFKAYKSDFDRKSVSPSNTTDKPEPAQPNVAQAKSEPEERLEAKKTSEIVYKVQILASPYKFSDNSPKLKGLSDISCYQENGIYKYTCGECSSMEEALVLRNKMSKNFNGAFIVAFKDGARIK
jgi:N-acetylmuramoyl-L-alanine amidase